MEASPPRRTEMAVWPAIAALLLAWWGTAACQRRDTLPRQAGKVPTDSLFLDATSGLDHRERIVVRDSAAWSSMWDRLTATQALPLRPPPVGFDSSLVVVVSAGSTGAGHSIRIDSINATDTVLNVYVRETMNFHCGQSDLMLRSPAHAVRVRLPAGSVRFVEDSAVNRCPRP